ncbi:hypothetical protein [Pedobacter alluvionis]|uniref:Uncharacterized protein n=1 Tax=Pedobacter alluvionis TaxID=475253 RepID=A0A497YDR0_9SPHI|nr:hypothetical protein [Pedobacter alluvionis]RLJ80636.1 hypothetical protein BCL90_1427 [Pedobacter alluvionis]TFB31895.1 hypothetical protein E3V97_15090 [Pedobacter alluvionis]
MNSYANKTPENKIADVANFVTKSASKIKLPYNFADNRPTAIAQLKLQQAVNNSLRLNGSTAGRVIQRMEEEKSIGERLSKRSAFKKMTDRQKKLFGGIDGDAARAGRRSDAADRSNAKRQELRDAVRRNLWNGRSRPAFTHDTLNQILAGTDSKARKKDGVKVYRCKDGKFYPRKKDRVGKEPFVSIDHNKNWKEYILSTAEPEEDGNISKVSASVAYNDLTNLVLMSSNQNSSKNGPKGVFD